MSDADDEWSGSRSAAALSQAAESPHAASSQLGVARYQTGGLLGRGGMGEVSVAHDPLLGRDVAIKTPRDERHAAALLHEAKITARLEHPAIVPVLDAGTTADGQPFYAMRIVGGADLSTLLASTPSGAARLGLVRFVVRAAHAIAHAHERGIVHRDLSPRNIRVGAHDEVLVMDWGLATEVAQAQRARCGTPGFRAPELEAEGLASFASDVWSLGAILAACLLGAPVSGASSWPRWVPRPLRAIAERATSPQPANRYRDGAELAEDLEAYLEGRPVRAFVERPWDRLARLVRRSPRSAITVAAASVVTALGIGVFGTFALRARDEARSARAGLEQAVVRLQEDKLTGLMRADRGAAAQSLAQEISSRVASSPIAAASSAVFEQWPTLSALNLGEEGPCRTVAVGPAGARVCRRGAELRVEAGAESRPLASSAGLSSVVMLSESRVVSIADPTGSHLFQLSLHHADGGVSLSDAPTGGVGVLTEGPGSELAVTFAESRVRLVGEAWAVDRPCPHAVALQASTFSGKELLTVCANLTLVDGAGAAVPIPSELRGTTALAAPTESVVVMGSVEGRVGAFDRRRETLISVADAKVGPIRSMRALNESLIVIEGDAGFGVWRWQLGAWHWLVDRGTWRGVGVVDGAVISWDEERRARWTWTGDAFHSLGHQAGLSAAATARDGDVLAVGAADGTVMLIDLSTSVVRRHRAAAQVIKSLAFDSTGRELLVGAAGPAGLQRLSLPSLEAVPTDDAFRARRVGYLGDDSAVAFDWGGGQWTARDGGESTSSLASAVRDVASTPDGALVLALLEDGHVLELKAGGPAELRFATPGARAIALAPNGHEVLVLEREQLTLRTLDGETRRTFELDGPEIDALAVGVPGLLALGRRDGTVELRQLSEGAVKLRASLFAQRVGALVFDPLGRWLFASSWDGTGRLISLKGLQGEAVEMPLEARSR